MNRLRSMPYIRSTVISVMLFLSASGVQGGMILDHFNMFELNVCNTTSQDIQLSIFHQSHYEAGEWVLSSWFLAKAKNCSVIGIFPKGKIYLYGISTINPNIEWSGPGRRICTSTRQTQRVVYENELCLNGEFNKQYKELNVTDKNYTYTLTKWYLSQTMPRNAPGLTRNASHPPSTRKSGHAWYTRGRLIATIGANR